jgi:hypothetical protein
MSTQAMRRAQYLNRAKLVPMIQFRKTDNPVSIELIPRLDISFQKLTAANQLRSIGHQARAERGLTMTTSKMISKSS